MRGAFLHTDVLVARVEELLRGFGARVCREYAVSGGRRSGFIDLFAVLHTHRIACEAELSADRVVNDVAKATAARADLLLIVTPERRIARAVAKRLDKAGIATADECLEVWVLPLGVALKRLRNRCHLMTPVNVPTTSRHQTSGDLGAQRESTEQRGADHAS